MPVDLVARRLEQRIGIGRVGGHDPADGTTQMLTPSWRRVYTSRACSSAMRASVACTLPACLCSSPERARMKTSKSGHVAFLVCSCRISSTARAAPARRCVASSAYASGRLAHPAAVLVRALARLEPLAIAGAVALEHRVELAPVDRAETVVLRWPRPSAAPDPAPRARGTRACGTVTSTNFWRSSSLVKRLIFQRIDCAVCFDSASRRAEHHQRRPPPAIERALRHARCSGVPRASVHHDLEALALVKALFLADAHHRARIRAVGAAADRDLVHDRRAVDQPADRADVGPGRRRVVEDARVLRRAGRAAARSVWSRDTPSVSAAL